MKGENERYTYTEVSKTMFVTERVSVRTNPIESRGSDIIDISKDEAVKVLAKCNETGWYRVELADLMGFAISGYVPETSLSDTNSEGETVLTIPTPTPKPTEHPVGEFRQWIRWVE